MRDWLVTWTHRRGPAVRLLCLPPAGGTATQFRDWGERLPDAVEVVAVELPGRGFHRSEPPITEMERLVAALAAEVGHLLDRPYAIFGHSVGALIGLEFAHALRGGGHPEADALFAAACCAPEVFYSRPSRTEPTDEELLAELSESGGVSAAILENPKYRRMLLGALRADVSLSERYRPADREPLTCPVFAYWGAADSQVPQDETAGWRSETRGRFVSRMLPGGHFFPVGQRDALLRVLQDDLVSAVAGQEIAG
ncbi:alpha/beta fold hydrolase [Actinomadura sp. 7K507]|uniref:thioesterase II family protein n=1 Tax=Actinomadura sp. 7K507 TaxID=2530365 RepID=UPI001046A55D|nr:alpha/beta fold hydrolase [Actinomadura sp. 7K507]TDC86445.1 thioesterase [Actinomadura sp. 7K507]